MGIFKLNGIDYMGGGGSGNTNYEELTQLEYDALTEEEKNNGTIYFIKDTNSNQDGKFQPTIYSESEREIGVWTDGKPLYQKTYIVNNISADTEIDLNIPNIEKVINQWGTWDRTDGINNGPWAYDLNAVNETSFANNFIVLCRVRIGPNKLYIGYPSTAAYGTIPEIRCTIQYTKSTDSPGSGQWTPQGVPAHHYSTEEQIVGTWVDGSTVYEKTIFISGTVAGTYQISISGIKDFLSYNGYIHDNWTPASLIPIPRVASDGNNIGISNIYSDYITFVVPSAYSSRLYDAYITIRYTKQSPS